MAIAAEQLRPRLPVRGPGLTVNACAFILTTQAGDLDQLAVVATQLAREHTGCSAAQLLLEDHPDGAAAISAAAAGDSRRVDLPLAHGRALLSLHFASDVAALIDADSDDCGWIDLLDLRLRELLTARDLRREAAAAHRSEHLQEALYAIADLAYSNLDVGEMLASVHQIVGRLTYAKNFYIALYDDARDAMHFPYNADEGEAAMSQAGVEVVGADYPNSLTFAVLHTGRSLLGPSRDLRAALGLGDDVRLGLECVDWLGVPMLEGERVRGAVVVQSYDERVRYSEDDRSLLAFVAQHILTAVSRKQAQEELEAEVLRRTAELAQANDALRQEAAERERAQRLQAALFRIAELASERGSIAEFYAGVHHVVSGLLNARNFFIALLSEDGTELHFPYLADERDEALHTRRLTNGITEWVLRQRRPLLATASEIRALIEAGEMVMFGSLPECWLGVPLMLDGRAFGVMAIQSYDSDQDYGPAEQEILQFASFHIATAFERRQTQERLRKANIELEKRVESRTRELKLANADLRNQIVVREQIESQLQHEALHDALTGLPNRTALLSKMESALARFQADPSRMFAVLFLDLDRFKVVNDSVGHLLGDELLIEAGRRIAACARGPDSVARLGGDEFTLLIEDIHGIDDAKHVAKRVIAALVDPIRVGEKEIYSSASVGIALAHSRYRRPDELLRDADVAMYRAKAHGRQRFEVFDEQLHQEALDILDLESDLRRALLRHQFEPYLQPIVRLADGAVLGYEALLRWRHSSRGLLVPGQFLAVAEDSGSVEQIDWQLYEQVLRAIPDLGAADTYVGINVSARHFRSANLAQTLLEMIDAYKVPPWRIRIEVTEGALLHNPEQACATMLRLRDAGVLTSLDDFGTGYSSLSYLHRFPLHALKIDRSFVAELQPDLSGSSAAVVRAIRALAGSLNMEVIAEGIETQVQCDALKQLECTTGQGFLFAHPQPARDFVRLRG